MNVNPGELNKRIRIIRRADAKDADGYSALPDEEAVHTCWAKFTRTSGAETVKANADFGEERSRFLIRATAKRIDRKMVVRYDGKDYEILFINEYGDAREYTEIWCRRLTPEG